MKVINSYRRSARVTEEIEDTRAIAEALASMSTKTEDGIILSQADVFKDLPMTYIVKIQVRILFVWVTIWSESCDISDGDTRIIIKQKADEIFKIMEVNI